MNIGDSQNAVKHLNRARRRHILWSLCHTYGILITIVSISVLMWIGILAIVSYLLIGKWWW